MKVNKVSHWVYAIFMLLPFVFCGFYMLIPVFSHTFDFSSFNEFDYFDTFSNMWSNTSTFSWVSTTSIYSTFVSFTDIVSGGTFADSGLEYYFAYGLIISLVYLGYEVLLAFINIARKLVYAFVDKEF